MCIRDRYEAAGRLQDAKSVWLSPIVEFGVYVINNDSLPFPHMIDRAKLALKETSTELRGRLRYAVYDLSLIHICFGSRRNFRKIIASKSTVKLMMTLTPPGKTNPGIALIRRAVLFLSINGASCIACTPSG